MESVPVPCFPVRVIQNKIAWEGLQYKGWWGQHGSTFLIGFNRLRCHSGLANPALKSALSFRNKTVSPVSPLLRRWKSFSTVGSSISFEKVTMEEPPLSPRNNLKAAVKAAGLKPCAWGLFNKKCLASKVWIFQCKKCLRSCWVSVNKSDDLNMQNSKPRDCPRSLKFGSSL